MWFFWSTSNCQYGSYIKAFSTTNNTNTGFNCRTILLYFFLKQNNPYFISHESKIFKDFFFFITCLTY